MRAPAQRPGDSAGCAGGSGSNSYTGSRHQERTDLRADAALHHRSVSSGAGQAPPGGQLIPGGCRMTRHSVHIKVDGRTYAGACTVDRKVLTVTTSYGKKSTQVGHQVSHKTLAHQL